MNKIYFSKVFKGYSPEEVEAFIIKLNTDFQQKQMEFAAETKRLSSEINEQKQRFEETISENERLASENRELAEANERLNEANKETDELNRQLNEEKQNLLDEIKALNEKKAFEPSVASLPETKPEPEEVIEKPFIPEVKPVDNGSISEKAKNDDYRKLCEQMGEKLLIADSRAQEIIDEARQEAAGIIKKAVENANVEVKKLITEASNRADKIYAIIDDYEKKQVFISAGLEQARKHIADAIGEVEALVASKKNEEN